MWTSVSPAALAASGELDGTAPPWTCGVGGLATVSSALFMYLEYQPSDLHARCVYRERTYAEIA